MSEEDPRKKRRSRLRANLTLLAHTAVRRPDSILCDVRADEAEIQVLSKLMIGEHPICTFCRMKSAMSQIRLRRNAKFTIGTVFLPSCFECLVLYFIPPRDAQAVAEYLTNPLSVKIDGMVVTGPQMHVVIPDVSYQPEETKTDEN